MFTKTDYLLFSQCQKAFWLQKHHPSTVTREDGSAENEALLHAMKKYPNGVEVTGDGWEERERKTKQLIEEGVRVLYRPVMRCGERLVAPDIAQKGDNGWKMSKVTSATSVKERLLDGLSYEWHDVLEKMPSVRVEILAINKEYVRGETLDYEQLFAVTDVTSDILERTSHVRETIKKMDDAVKEPSCQKDIGPHCSKYGKESIECPAKKHCWAHVPPYSVFNITRIGKKAWDLYEKGIVAIEDVPPDFKLSDSQQFQVEAEKNPSVVCDKEEIRAFLKTFRFPLYFLDFETYQQPIPLYEGVRPYQQIPFQYSLHILSSLMDNLEHKEFLAQEGRDDRRMLAEALVRDIPRDVCVVVFNMSFEKMVLKDLAALFTDLSDHLMNIHDNIVDLMIPFQKKWYYMPEMKGSYSIKYVLPALFPDDESLDYGQLAIQNGAMAMDSYQKLPSMSREEREEVRQALLHYCRLDTLAMVKIWEVLYFLT